MKAYRRAYEHKVEVEEDEDACRTRTHPRATYHPLHPSAFPYVLLNVRVMIFFHRVSPREEDPPIHRISVYNYDTGESCPKGSLSPPPPLPSPLIIAVPFRGNVSRSRSFHRATTISRRSEAKRRSTPASEIDESTIDESKSKLTGERVVGRTGFSPAVPSRKGLRHPGYTGVPPGCPRGCNEDKSLAYLINSQRSTARSVPFHILSRRPSTSSSFSPLPVRAPSVFQLRGSNRERVFAPDPTRNVLCY